jgi:hypothetical protein
MNASLIQRSSHPERFLVSLRGPYTTVVFGFSFAGLLLPTVIR